MRRWIARWAMVAWLTFGAFAVLIAAIAQAAIR